MSIKKNNTYFEKNNGKVYYIDEGVKTDVPSSAFGDIDNKINTKLDTSAFEDVSGTFYTTANPSGFIDKSVNDLTNYYTTAQTYSQTEIDEKLADFGGFEVVSLTTGTNPHPDVNEPSTKIIYLTKATTAQVTDPYSEWIFTSADAQTTAWECIGETTVDLSDYQTTAAMSSYYTKSETSGATEISNALTAKQDTLTFNYNNTTITGINSSAVGQVLQAGTDLAINNGVISVNTDGIAIGTYAFAEGQLTSAIGGYSHAEGNRTSAGEYYSHAEGNGTKALGYASHAEGQGTRAAGDDSHAEGFYTSALGDYSHAEGGGTYAAGARAHAEGGGTSAVGDYSHTEGYYTSAVGYYSHAEGSYTVAGDSAMHVGGKYNQTSSNAAFVIGNGSANNSRSDAFIVEWDGTVSAKKFVDTEVPLTVTGGDYVSVTEDTANNKLVIDLETSLGQMMIELSAVLSAKPSTGRHILGVDGGTLTWLEINQ